MRIGARLAAVLVTTIGVIASLPPAATATRPTMSATASVTASVTTSADDGVEQQPTQAEIDAQSETVRRLEAQVAAQEGDVKAAKLSLEEASLLAGAALERYTAAIRALRVAQLAEEDERDRLQQAQDEVDARQAALGRWARAAYQGGGPSSPGAMATFLQARSGEDLGTAITLLRRVGESKSRDLAAYTLAVEARDQATTRAQAATEAATAQALAATNARDAADAAVARHRDSLATSESTLASTKSQAADAERRRNALDAARAYGAGEPGDNRVTGAVGTCTGAGVEQYGNGNIPLSVLCPLWGVTGQYLRGDAAFAFNRLSRAYAAAFGDPICVTDSYRSYDAQVRLYHVKPNLAAVPGTSNHGWGTATDLCGGIQNFGTRQHLWLKANAPQYGWFHPAWAEQDGSRPEPWHWEFAG